MSQERLGRYHVLGSLGGGGQGQVYRAYDPELRVERAVKVLADDQAQDAEARGRLKREAQLASRLRHHGICGIHDVGEDDGRLYVVMDLLDGETLAQRLLRGALDPEGARTIAVAIAEALAYAHAQGVVHRDLSSANVMVAADGHVVLLDFGLARQVAGTAAGSLPTATMTGVVVGTPDYIAPEVLHGARADARADVWALGVLLHEMLTAERPFHARGVTETLAAVLQSPPPALPPTVPAWLTAVTHRCLEKDPERRLQSATEVREALLRGAAPPATRARGSRVFRVGSLAGLAAVVAGASLLLCRPPAVRALAVLPLDNLSGDPSQQYIADGMTDELITTLAQLSALRVTSRSSVMGYRAKPKPLGVVARELHVQDVIEGSVMRAGDQIRVTARLIGARADQPLWAESYVRPFHDVLTLQNELARTIADQVQIRLTDAEKQRLARQQRVDPEVYGLCLRARLAWNELTESGMRASPRLYEQAIARDSGYAPAWAGLSEAYWALSGWYEAPGVVMPRALAAARRAIALDDGLADGHAALGTVLMEYAWDWDGAERELRRAIALEPSHATAHRELGFLMRYRGRYEEDRAEVQTSVALDPLTPYTVGQQGWPELFSRRYAEAVRIFEAVARAHPNSEVPHNGLGIALEQLHQYPRAIMELERAAQLAPVTELRSALAHAYAMGGQTARARALLDSLEHPAAGGFVQPGQVAIVHVGLGDRAGALDLLEQAYGIHDAWVPFLKVDPRFDPLRSEPRFQALLTKLGV